MRFEGFSQLLPARKGRVWWECGGAIRPLPNKTVRNIHIAHCFKTAEELCTSPEVDAVFITSPDAMHRADTLMAVKGRKAILCEKPVAMNAAEAREMSDAANAAGVLYGVAQNFRYNRSLDWMREQIRAGKIGKPQLAHAEFAYPADRSPRKWIMDPSLATGGPIADVGVHCIDALRYVLGEDVESVSTLASKARPEDEVEATASLQMQMTGSVLANVTVSARAPYRTHVEVTGTDGVLVAENGLTVDRPVELTLRRAGEVVETVTLENADAYTRMLDSFALALRRAQASPQRARMPCITWLRSTLHSAAGGQEVASLSNLCPKSWEHSFSEGCCERCVRLRGAA